MKIDRRKFFNNGIKAGLGLGILSQLSFINKPEINDTRLGKSQFRISLAQWSLRDWLNTKKISNLEFPSTAKNTFGIDAVEYVSTFFRNRETDENYLRELKQRTDDENIRNVQIMVDMWGPDGTLASADPLKRKQAAGNHFKWVDVAKYLGCHAIRVNASGYEDANYSDSKNYFVDGLSQLVEYGEANQINILVENHGGYSSNAYWLTDVMKEINNKYCGVLPDFGNFRIDKEQGTFYPPLIGLSQLMPFAKGISAKANQFDVNGNETTIDYPKMMAIVEAAKFSGFVGIEWGGGGYTNMAPEEGIKATKDLLTRLL